MITDQARSAILALQTRALKSHDNYELERIERALDEIVRNPDNSTAAAFQARSASANAAKIIKNRRYLVPIASLDVPHDDPDNPVVGRTPDAATPEHGYAVIEVLAWVHTADGLAPRDRLLVGDLASGEDATSIAVREGVPLARVRERISRVRRVAHAAYRRDVGAAA